MRKSERLTRWMRLLGNQEGFVFIVALIALAVLFLAVTSLGSLASGANTADPYWRDNSEAVYVAESGINHAIWKLTYDKEQVVWSTYPDGTPTLTSNDPEIQGVLPANSSYQVWLQEDSADPLHHCFATVLASAGTGSNILRIGLKVPALDEGPEGPKKIVFNPPEGTEDLGPLQHTTSDDPFELTQQYYMVDDMILGAQSQTWITGQDYVYIFVYGDLSIEAGAQVNIAGIDQPTPKLVFIMMNDVDPASQTVKVAGGSESAIMVWSYGATVIMNKNAYVFGSVIGDSSNKNAVGPTPDPAADTVPWPEGTVVDWVDDDGTMW